MTRTCPKNETTLKALRESIEHWDRFVTGTQSMCEDTGPTNCSLCRLFYWSFGCGSDCEGCPVAAKSGETRCDNTPYQTARLARDEFGLGSIQFRVAAWDELVFLVSLLPEAEGLAYNMPEKP